MRDLNSPFKRPICRDGMKCARCGDPVDDPWRIRPDDEMVYHGTCLLNQICAGPPARRAER